MTKVSAHCIYTYLYVYHYYYNVIRKHASHFTDAMKWMARGCIHISLTVLFIGHIILSPSLIPLFVYD